MTDVRIGAMNKRISADAYQALRDALPVIFWNKRPFETFLKTVLRDHAELLIGLNFNETKRIVADQLIDRLIKEEHKYQSVTLQLMLEVSGFKRFSNVERIADAVDRAERLKEAQDAVTHLALLTERYSELLSDQEKQAAARETQRTENELRRRFSNEIDEMHIEYLSMHKEADVHRRGYALEGFLNRLFAI